jgi:hypothetical protein
MSATKTKPGTAVATQEDNLPLSPEELEALRAQQEAEYDDEGLSVPILKIGQPLTREVQNEQAEAGEFINTLSGEGLGTKVEFVAAYYQKGRFAADRESGRAYVAFGSTIPAHWADLVGDEFVDTPFDEYPDAEEMYKERVNRKEIPWGKGPLVSTTHNYTGLVIPAAVEGDDEVPEPQPVRLSLQRTNVPAHRRIRQLHRSLGRSKNLWDIVFELGTEKKTFDRGASHLLTVKIGRQPTAEERAAAAELAVFTAAGRVSDNSASDSATDKPVEPDAQGGLAV